jgi:hypothetical protein
MQKYLKITGLTAGFNTESLVPVYSVAQVIKDGTGPDFNFVLLRNFSSHSSGDIVTISHANGTEAQNVEMCNFISDLIVKANQRKYTEPYLEIAATDFPRTVTNVVIN